MRLTGAQSSNANPRWGAMIGGAVLLTGCAAPQSYMGIDLTAPAVAAGHQIASQQNTGQPNADYQGTGQQNVSKQLSDNQVTTGNPVMAGNAQAYPVTRSSSLTRMDIPPLARLAQAGDKAAQLQLGIRFEEGRGVARDLRKAKKLYEIAMFDKIQAGSVEIPPAESMQVPIFVDLDKVDFSSVGREAMFRLLRLNASQIE